MLKILQNMLKILQNTDRFWKYAQPIFKKKLVPELSYDITFSLTAVFKASGKIQSLEK